MMLRSILHSVLLILLVVAPTITTAQTTPAAICTENIIAEQANAAAEIDLGAACITFTACVEAGQNADLCQLRAAVEQVETCAEADGGCVNRALLAAAALDPVYWDAYLPMADEPTVVAALNAGWQAIGAGEYPTAAESFTTVENSQYNPMLLLSRAVAERLDENPSAALGTLETALDHSPAHSLVRYGRLLVLNDLGQAEDAAIAAYELAGFASRDAQLMTFAESIQSAYPLDLSTLETWLLYPVQRSGGGPGGRSISDQHQQPAQPLNLLRMADGRVLLFDYFAAEVPWTSDDVSPLVVRFPDGAEFNSVEGFTSLTLSAMDGGYQLVSMVTGFEFFTQRIGLLMPSDAPDPRTNFTTIQCDYLSSLTPGQYVVGPAVNAEVATVIDLYDAPGGTVIATVPPLRLLDTTECIDGTLWWAVEGGWVRVNDGPFALLGSVSALDVPLYCPNVLPPRLGPLTASSVISGSGAQLIRSEASLSAAEVGSLPEDVSFFTSGEPFCAEGTVWYAVEHNGVAGWVAESAEGRYLLEPLPPTG
jgi:hypothetical protein